MSKTVDERVVEMRFDNAQFEKNVQTSMLTLDKLKQKLNLSGSAKGLEGISSAAKKVDMSGLSTGIDTVHAKFSALQVMGVTALASATPVDSGLTANSWYYKIEKTNDSISLLFCNSNIQNGVPIAVILQYGHGTRNGGWVQGRDYINPAIQPIFDQIVKEAWGEVTKL